MESAKRRGPPPDEVENVIVGGGPAGAACARALAMRGIPFTMVVSGADSLARIRSRREAVRRALVRDGAPPLEARFGSLKGSGVSASQKGLFGIETMYEDPSAIAIETTGNIPLKASPSSGVGGYSLVWGASLLPLREVDIQRWPHYLQDINSWYEAVASEINYSACHDSLEPEFPLFGRPSCLGKTAAPIAALLEAFGSKEIPGFLAGASRLAIDSDPTSPNRCRECGWCLSGCAWDSIFHSDLLYEGMTLLDLVTETSVIGLEESDDYVILQIVGANGNVSRIRAQTVFLAAGPVASSALVCQAAGLDFADLNDNQAISVPLMLRRATGKSAETQNVSLAQAFIEEIDEDSELSRVHWQIYPRGPELTSLLTLAPPHRMPHFAGRLGAMLIHPAHGFLDSSVSGSVRVSPLCSRSQLRIMVEARRPQSVVDEARRGVSSLARALLKANLSFAPSALRTLEPVGGSYHLASSFPHRESNTSGSRASDIKGRPAGLRRIHLVDASVLPQMPPQSPTFTVMANAMRIASL